MRHLRATAALSAREVRRFVRRPTRIVATIGTPALVWVFLAGGFAQLATDDAAQGTDDGTGFAAFALPGVALLVVMFSSIFASISLISDRKEGFLRAVLASPCPRSAIVAAKVGTGTLLALAQAVVLLAGLPLLGIVPDTAGWTVALVGLACGSAACIGLGLGLAWWIDSAEGFHGVMNLVLMPMWLLSGAFTPAETTAGWFGAVVRLNPLGAVLRVIRSGLESSTPAASDIAVAIVFALGGVILAWATMMLSGRTSRPTLEPQS